MDNFSSLFQQRRYAECENACRGILLANARHLQARNTLILALQAQGKIGAAVTECEALLNLLSEPADKIKVLEHQGAIAASTKDFETAVKSYEQALKLDKNRLRTWIALGSCQYELNLYDASTRSILKGINDPRLDDLTFGEALYFLAQSNPSYTSSDIQELLPRSQKSINSVQYHFAMGLLNERQEEYEQALEYYDQGNRLLRKRTPYNSQQEVGTIQRYMKLFGVESITTDTHTLDKSYPVPIFIVGMPRSGSTLLEQMLGRHSQISPQGEVSWLPDAFRKNIEGVSTEEELVERCLSKDFITTVREQYFGNLRDGTAPYITDKLPGNFAFLFLIRLAFPEALVLKTSRERLANIWSCYKTLIGNGHSYTHSLSETASYYDLVEASAEQWHIAFEHRFIDIVYEKLITDPSACLSKILDTLKLNFEEECIDPSKATRVVKTASKNQVTKPIYLDANESSQNFQHLIVDRISDQEQGWFSE